MKAPLTKLRNSDYFNLLVQIKLLLFEFFLFRNILYLSLSLLAIEFADCNNTNLLANSVFIKMQAIVCLGDFVPAFKLAVWCKHLRPNVSRFTTSNVTYLQSIG